MVTKHIVKNEPELSANQLSAFLRAEAPGRETILQRAKYQMRSDTPRRIRYKEIRSPIAQFFSSNRNDFGPLYEVREKLQAALAGKTGKLTDFMVSDCKLSIEALDAFIGGFNQFNFKGMTFQLGSHRPPRLDIEGVGISVRPDVVVTAKTKDMEKRVGGILSFFSKDVDDEGKAENRKELGLTSALLVLMYAQQHLTSHGQPQREMCMSLDVFGQEARIAPKAYKQRLERIEASCREITRQWALIKPPLNWPG